MIFHCLLVVRALAARAHHGAKHTFAHAAGHARRTTRHVAISTPTRAVATKVCVAVGLAALGAAGPVADGATLPPNPPVESSRPPSPAVGPGAGWAGGWPDPFVGFGPDWAGGSPDAPIPFDPDWPGGLPDPRILFDPDSPGDPGQAGGPPDPSTPLDPPEAHPPDAAPAVAEPSGILLLAFAVAASAVLRRRARRVKR